MIFLPFLLALTACNPAEKFLFFIEPYTWEIINSRGIDHRGLDHLLKKYDYRLLLVTVQPEMEAVNTLKNIILNKHPHMVFISPLFPFNVEKIISQFPETLFILPESLVSKDALNLIKISFKREEAFFKAGELSGKLVNNPSFSDYIKAQSGIKGPLKVGILISILNDSVKEEIAAFQNGFKKTSGPSYLVIKEIGNLTDRVKAKRLLEKMKEEGVAITLLKTYTLNLFCLEFLKKQGSLAIVEDWLGSGSYEKTVLMSIEEDLAAALENSLEYYFSQDRTGGSSRSVVDGPVRVVWGDSFKEADFAR